VSLGRIAFGLHREIHSDCGYWFRVSRLVVYWWTSGFKFKSSWLCQWSRSSCTKITHQLTSPRQNIHLCCASVTTVQPPFRESSLCSVHNKTALVDNHLAMRVPNCVLFSTIYHHNNIPSYICMLRLLNLTWRLITMLHAWLELGVVTYSQVGPGIVKSRLHCNWLQPEKKTVTQLA
jgi:hypothetical protein